MNNDWIIERLKHWIEGVKIHGSVSINSDGQGNMIDLDIRLKDRKPKLNTELNPEKGKES